jgi:hypothetical protein
MGRQDSSCRTVDEVEVNAHHHGKIEDSFTIGEDKWGNPSDRDLWKLIYNRLPVYLQGDDRGDLNE